MTNCRAFALATALILAAGSPPIARADTAQGSVSAASDGHGAISLAWIVRPDLYARTTFRVIEVRPSGSALVATVRQGDAAAANGVSAQDFQIARSLSATFSAQKPGDQPRIAAILAMKMIADPAFARAAGFGTIVHSDRGGVRHYRIETDGGVAFESVPIDSQIATAPPPVPAGLHAANVDGGVALTWDPPARGGPVPVAAYRVERVRNGEAVALTATPLVTGITWVKGRTLVVDRTAPAGASLTYRVRSRDALGREGVPATLAFEPINVHALRPIMLKATLREGAVALEWTPRADPQTAGYVLERSAMLGGPYQTLTPGASLAANVGTYLDRTPVVGNAPFYRIRMVSPRGDVGPPSPAVVAGVIAGPAPAPPAGVRADVQRTRVRLSWEAAAGSRVAGYFIERSHDFNGKWGRLNSVLTPFNEFVDAIGVHGAGTLQYRVIAVGTDERRSGPSTVVAATFSDERPPADVTITDATSSAGVVHIAFRPAAGGRAPARYIVYRAASAVARQTAVGAELPAGARTVDDTTELAGERVWYRVVGLDASGRRGRLSTAVAANVAYDSLPPVGAPTATYETDRPAKVRLHFAKAPPNTLLAVQVRSSAKRWRWLLKGLSDDTNAVDLAPQPGNAAYRIATMTMDGRTGPWSTPATVTVPKK